MRHDRLPVVVLVVALAALLSTGAWAGLRMTGSSSTEPYYGSMMRSGGMMGYATGATDRRVIGLGDAKRLAQGFADRLGLTADEVLQFERNYYVKLVDRKGRGATEVLVDPETGAVSLEYGPAMMWNTHYGMHGLTPRQMMGGYGAGMMGGGMMGGYSARPVAGSAIDLATARGIAQTWLDENRAGLGVEPGGDPFPGYYTFEVLRQGKIEGMLSVNATSRAVVYHWWHGAFVAELNG